MDETTSQLPLSDNRRRLICRSSFLLFCAIPTLGVFYAILHPYSAYDWQQLIEAKLGIAARIDSVETVSPWETVLRGVELRDPQIGTLLEATEVRILRGKPDQMIIEHPVQLTNTAIRRLSKAIRSGLARDDLPQRTLKIHFEQASIHDDHSEKSTIAHGVDIIVKRTDDSVRADIFFNSAPANETPAVIVAFMEHQQTAEGVVETVQLNTKNQAIGCWLLASFVPELEKMGPAATFEGIMETKSGNVNGQLSTPSLVVGKFHNAKLGAPGSAYPITGLADIGVNCEIQNGKIYRLNLSGKIEKGTLRSDLLQFGQLHFGLQKTAANHSGPYAFDQIEFNLEIAEGKLVACNQLNILPTNQSSTPLTGHSLSREIGIQELASFILQPDTALAQSATKNQLVDFLGHFHLPDPLPVNVAAAPDQSQYR